MMVEAVMMMVMVMRAHACVWGGDADEVDGWLAKWVMKMRKAKAGMTQTEHCNGWTCAPGLMRLCYFLLLSSVLLLCPIVLCNEAPCDRA
jgi:hypothetical protein